MRKLLPFFLFVLLVSPAPALAYRHQVLNEVLGVSTQAAVPVTEPTAEGPGLILPDSPFFFLDQIKQNVRLFFAFSPEEKAKIHAQIAGERLAELRFMLAKNDTQAVMTDLQGISTNLAAAASDVSKAQFAGKDVSVLARTINDNIKAKQKALDVLETGTTGVLHLEAAQTQEALFESKIEVEDSLPEDQIQSEVNEDLARRIKSRVSEASASAKLLRSDLSELEKEASDAAKTSLKRREDALKKAIEKKDEALRKVEEKLLENEKKRQEILLEAQKKAGEEALKALESTQNAAVGFQRASQKLEEIKTNSPTTSGSSGSSSSSSGSSGGGSGSGGSSNTTTTTTNTESHESGESGSGKR